MPLVPATLQSQLESLFAGPPETHAECAQAWTSAVEAYAAAIVPASTAVTAACSTLSAALASAFQVENGAVPLMEAAFLAFGATVGGGMAPAFVAAPPAGPVGFAGHFADTYDSHADAASGIADLIDTWMKTGTATPSVGGSAVNWS